MEMLFIVGAIVFIISANKTFKDARECKDNEKDIKVFILLWAFIEVLSASSFIHSYVNIMLKK